MGRVSSLGLHSRTSLRSAVRSVLVVDRSLCRQNLLENHGNLVIVSTQPVARNIWDTAPQCCGLKHDHERSRGKCRCRRIAPRLKAAESLAADFVEWLNQTAEIGAAVDAVL